MLCNYFKNLNTSDILAKMVIAKNRQETFLFILALIAASAILFLPFPVSGIVIFAFVAILMMMLFPKTTMTALAIFLPFQKLLASQVDENSPFFSALLKRSEEGMILIAFLIIVLGKIFTEKKLKRTNIELPLFILISIAIISTLQSNLVPYTVAFFDLFLFLKGFLVFYIFHYLQLTDKEIRTMCRVLLVMASLIFLLGVADLIVPVYFRNLIHNVTQIRYRSGIPSVQSIFVHPGIFGWFMAFFTCFSLAYFIILEKKRDLIFLIPFALGTALSMRLKPLVGLLAAGLSAFILSAKGKRIKLVFVLVIFFMLFAVLFGEKTRLLLEDKIYAYVEAPSVYSVARNALYATGFRIAQDYFPLGSGLATFGGWIAANYYSPLYIQYGLNLVWGLEPEGSFLTDTFWPYIFAQFGVLGFLCYVWILISIFRTAFRAFRKTEDLFLKAFTLGSILVFVEGIAESVAEPIFLTPPQYFFIFASLGIVYAIAARKKEARDTKI